MQYVTYVSLMSSWQREGEIDEWLYLSRDVLTVHTFHLVLQLTLECLRDHCLVSWRGVVMSQMLVDMIQQHGKKLLTILLYISTR